METVAVDSVTCYLSIITERNVGPQTCRGVVFYCTGSHVLQSNKINWFYSCSKLFYFISLYRTCANILSHGARVVCARVNCCHTLQGGPKSKPPTSVYIFAKYWPSRPCNNVRIVVYHTLTVSLHYFVKRKFSKITKINMQILIFWNYFQKKHQEWRQRICRQLSRTMWRTLNIYFITTLCHGS